jgi:uncharacterized damage-inducible protein DinB
MQMSEKDILRCLDMLTYQQIWSRSGEYENSIANLLLHLEGNLRQWILHGIDGQPDVRERDEEFTLTPSATTSEVRARFTETLAECCKVLGTLAPERLLEVIDPQPTGTWRHLTVLAAVFQVVGHVQLHTGQIIVLTKQLLAKDLDLSMPRKR